MKINYKIKEIKSLEIEEVSIGDWIMFDRRLLPSNKKNNFYITEKKLIDTCFYKILDIQLNNNTVEVITNSGTIWARPIWTSIKFFSRKRDETG